MAVEMKVHWRAAATAAILQVSCGPAPAPQPLAPTARVPLTDSLSTLLACWDHSRLAALSGQVKLTLAAQSDAEPALSAIRQVALNYGVSPEERCLQTYAATLGVVFAPVDDDRAACSAACSVADKCLADCAANCVRKMGYVPTNCRDATRQVLRCVPTGSEHACVDSKMVVHSQECKELALSATHCFAAAVLVLAPPASLASSSQPPAWSENASPGLIESSAHIREFVGGEGVPTSFACVGSRVPRLDLTAAHPERAGCDTVGSDPATTQSNPDHASDVHAKPNEFVLVRMRSSVGFVPPAAGGQIQEVVISAGSVTITRLAAAALSADALTVEVPLSELEVLNNGAVVTVRIDYTAQVEGERRASDVSYFTLGNRWSWFGLANSGVGFWIPVGLLVSNFKTTQDGIPLGTFPVGIAVGGRLYIRDSLYVGPSAMVSYATYPSTQNQATANASSSSTVNLQSGALGGLLDIGGYVYLGGAYLADLRSRGSSPGAMFVMGVGPQLVQFLQAASR